jgi:O-antigen/teichoic acid export membrane protein
VRLGQTSFVSFASQIAASVLGFAATLYITRVLGDAVYGQYMLFVATVLWLQVVGLLGTETALTQRLSREETAGRYITVGAVLVGFSVLAVVGLLYGLSDPLTAYLGTDPMPALAVLLVGAVSFALVRAVLSGEHRVHVANLLQPLNVLTRSAIQIAVVVSSAGIVGLLAGHAAGTIIAAAVGIWYVATRPDVPRREDFVDVLSFARYSWLGKIGSRAFSALDTIVLGFFVVSGLIGVYEAAWNLASVLAVFATAISQSVLPEISRADSVGDSDHVVGVLDDAVSYTGLFLIPGGVGALVIGERVMAIYGPEFARGAEVLVLLVAARLAYAYTEQFISALSAVDRPDLTFRVNGAFLAANVAGNVILVAAVGWYGAAIATLGSALIALVVAVRYAADQLDVVLPIREVGKQVMAATVMGLVVGGVSGRAPPAELGTVVLVTLGAVVYFAMLAAVSVRFRRVVRRNLPL